MCASYASSGVAPLQESGALDIVHRTACRNNFREDGWVFRHIYGICFDFEKSIGNNPSGGLNGDIFPENARQRVLTIACTRDTQNRPSEYFASFSVAFPVRPNRKVSRPQQRGE
jgi:hypothetical protein